MNVSTEKKAARDMDLIHVISDPTRIRIIQMIGCNRELCGKDILNGFSITQPTLSHHMSLLCHNDLIKARKEGKWVYYSLSEKGIRQVIAFFAGILDASADAMSIGDGKSKKKGGDKPALKRAPMLPTPKKSIPCPDFVEEDATDTKNKGGKKGKSKKGKKKKKK